MSTSELLLTSFADCVLFFGCRNSDKDFFFREEWRAFTENGSLQLFTAFSRDQVHNCFSLSFSHRNHNKTVAIVLSSCNRLVSSRPVTAKTKRMVEKRPLYYATEVTNQLKLKQNFFEPRRVRPSPSSPEVKT